jgi:hypothetical protein
MNDNPVSDDEYLTFDIRLIRVGSPEGETKLVVEGSGEVGEARDIFSFPKEEEHKMVEGATAGIFRDLFPPQAGTNKAWDQQAMREWTRKIAGLLMPVNVKSRYDAIKDRALDRNKGVRVRIFTYDAVIASIVWEAAYIGNDPLCLTKKTSVVRYVPAGEAPQPIALSRPIRILGIISDRTDLPALGHGIEKSDIEKAFEPRDKNLVQIDWLESANTKALQIAKFKDYHVVHYIGHGAYDPDKGIGSLAFEKTSVDAGNVTPSQFFRNLGNKVGFVFLNACDSGHEVGGIAEELVRRGIPAALGMRRSVLDTSAIEFAKMFYQTMAYGKPIDEALSEGRNAILNDLGGEYDTNDQWIQPILYMRAPDGRIFV